MGHYEIKPPMYEKFMEKNKCIHTNGMLESRLMYLYQDVQFNVINVSTTHTKYISRIKYAFYYM